MVSISLLLRGAAVALLSLSLSCLSPASAQPPRFNLSTPYVIPHSALTTLSLKYYSGCAWDLHAIVSHGQSGAFYQVGGLASPGWDANNNALWSGVLDYSVSPTFSNSYTSTFSPSNFIGNFTTPSLSSGYSPLARVAPGMAVLSNGAIVLMGGKIASTWAWVNDVIMSADKGQSWSQVTANAAWSIRSDMSLAVQPQTNYLVLCGGTLAISANPPYGSDCWVSVDGMGKTWTQQAATIPATQQAPMTFLYDAASNSNGAATLVMYNPSDNNVYSSKDWAASWTKLGAWQNGWPQQTGRLVADVENNLFMAGGQMTSSMFGAIEQNEGSYMFWSGDKGYTWMIMPQSTFYPGVRVADAVTVGTFAYGCLAINYLTSTSQSYGYAKQLLQFGGMIQNVVQDQNSWLNCSFTASLGSVSSIVNELIVPGEPVSLAAEGYSPMAPNFTGAASLVFRNAASQIQTWRNYPDCTYNVHAAAQRSSTVQMWQLGGFSSSWSYINTIDYSSTGQWNTYQTITPSYLPSATYPSWNYSTQSGKVAAGVAYLKNGALMLFGGKDSFGAAGGTNIGVNNDVFISMDMGKTWALTLLSAPWTPRSDMAVAVMPGTNYVLMGGGQTNPNYANIGDFWISQDGMGQTWTKGSQTPPFGVFQDAAIVFMYDNSQVSSSSKAMSTLLINTGLIDPVHNADSIYKSTDGGMTFTFVSTAPWTQRLRNNFVADFENNVFMSGGQGFLGDVWTSSDMGVTWTLMLQTPQSPGPYNNVFTYQGSQMNCMALRYFANSASPNQYHKQLVLFGGPNTIVVAQQSAPECVARQAVNVVYGEIIYQSEYAAGSSFMDTSVAAPPANTVPTMNFNGPSSLMPNRLYPECAYDVHAVLSGGSSPMTYALGGTDPNFIALPSIDRFSGSNTANFQTVTPVFNLGYARSSLSRWAAGAAVLSNGNLLWFAGKLVNFNMANDVWYSSDMGSSFQMGSEAAPWMARSDLGVAAVPGTNCVLLTSGANWSNNFNDVWTSCDGYGYNWTMQTAAAPWPLTSSFTLFAGLNNAAAVSDGVTYTSSNPAVVALYDAGGTATAPTNTILLYTASDNMVRTSKNLGATWTAGVEAVWPARVTAKFVADSSNNAYLVGGSPQNGEQQLAYSGVFVVQPDVWFSWDKGTTWTMLTQSTGAGYTNPVTLALASYSCASVVHNSGHRQVLMYSGQIDVYNNQNTVATGAWFNQPVCTCTSQTAMRSLFGDLIFPSEGTPNNLPSGSSSSSSKSYSPGQTAGIAIGVGVGVALLCLLFILFAFGAGAIAGKSGKSFNSSSGSGAPKKFEDEPSSNQSTNASEVQMNEARV